MKTPVIIEKRSARQNAISTLTPTNLFYNLYRISKECKEIIDVWALGMWWSGSRIWRLGCKYGSMMVGVLCRQEIGTHKVNGTS